MRISDWSSDVCSSDLCFIGTVRSVGLSPERTSIYTHMIREFLFSTAHRTTFELFPSQQREELEKTIAKLSPEKWPNVTFPQESLLEIDGDRVFHEGIELFMKIGRASCMARVCPYV